MEGKEREGFLWHHGILSWEFSKGGPQTSSSSITWELGHRILGSLPDQLRHSEGGAQWTGISHAFQAIGMHAQVSGSLCYMTNKISQNYVPFRSLCIYFWGLNFPLCSFYCCIKKHPKIHKHKEPFIIVSPGPRNGLSRAVAMHSLSCRCRQEVMRPEEAWRGSGVAPHMASKGWKLIWAVIPVTCPWGFSYMTFSGQQLHCRGAGLQNGASQVSPEKQEEAAIPVP